MLHTLIYDAYFQNITKIVIGYSILQAMLTSFAFELIVMKTHFTVLYFVQQYANNHQEHQHSRNKVLFAAWFITLVIPISFLIVSHLSLIAMICQILSVANEEYYNIMCNHIIQTIKKILVIIFLIRITIALVQPDLEHNKCVVIVAFIVPLIIWCYCII